MMIDEDSIIAGYSAFCKQATLEALNAGMQADVDKEQGYHLLELRQYLIKESSRIFVEWSKKEMPSQKLRYQFALVAAENLQHYLRIFETQSVTKTKDSKLA